MHFLIGYSIVQFDEILRARGSAVKEHIFLGTDRRNVEAARDRWLAENPTIKVLRVHKLKREPQSLLTRIGGRNVPRVSMTVDYEEADVVKR